jgi:hypothetical protein
MLVSNGGISKVLWAKGVSRDDREYCNGSNSFQNIGRAEIMAKARSQIIIAAASG